MSKVKRRWLKMGVELEGGWEANTRRGTAEKCEGAHAKTDGSVVIAGGFDTGEITTQPHSLLDKLCEDITAMHPARVNDTCGYHIHTSHTVLDYSALASEEFWSFFRAGWKAWGDAHSKDWSRNDRDRFWARLNATSPGAQRYCKAEFNAVNQLEQKSNRDLRYTQLNFSAYHKFKTLECRMLPMFESVEVTVAATRHWAAMLDMFLNDFDFPTIRLEREIVESGAEIVETDRRPGIETSFWDELKMREGKAIVCGPDIFYDIPGARDYLSRPGEETIDESTP